MDYELNYENVEKTEHMETIELLEEGVELEHIKAPKSEFIFLEDTERVYGRIEKDSECWECQVGKNSSDVCCQKYVAEQLLETHFNESEFADIARKNGWYHSEKGTACSDIGNILEQFNIKTEREENISISDLCIMLDNGEKVICLVNDSVLQCPELSEFSMFYPNQAIEVIGIDGSDKENMQVIVNDPKSASAKTIFAAETFFKAMGKNNFCVCTSQW